jgi:hypothetical protein
MPMMAATMGIRFVGTPNRQGQVIVTPQSPAPAGYRPAGPQPLNGAAFRDFLQAKAGIGSDGSRGFYAGSLVNFINGQGVVRR